MTEIRINGVNIKTDAPDHKPLLWVLRENLGLTGSKYGCGKGLCGACTVHVDGVAMRSCVLPISAIQGKAITTIEGLADGDSLHPLQQAWLTHNVPQCGYCQSGQLMSAASLLKENAAPGREEIRHAMAGNLCRCGTYPRIEQAILSVSATEAKS